MKKQISIVELYEHHEVVRILAKLFAEIGYDVSVFAEKAVITQLGALDAQYIVKPKAESQKEFMRKQMMLLNKSDLILFTTLVKYPKFFARLKFRPPSILLVHDGNYFLRPSAHIKISSFKDVLRWVKFRLFQEEKSRQQLLQSFTYVSFADDFIAQNLAKEIKSLNINVLPALPLTFFEAPRQPNPNQPIIIIPGSVTPARNYALVYDAFRKIENQITHPIELVLLGVAHSAYAKKVITQYKNLNPKKIKLTYFSTKISQEQYDDYLRKARFAIIPIKKDFVGGIFRETYGQTKITGSVNDVVRFGIPSLISDDYPTTADLFEPFEHSEELGNQILSWLKFSSQNKPVKDYSFDKMVAQIASLAPYFSQ